MRHQQQEYKHNSVISTPFHGYWKNIALAVSGKFDDHFTALWNGGHIKFF
jgi:2-polyprenyl-6-hydroxyphenyl methylase/3-demethylubiquinone-9 3-methyltransferase